MKKSSVIAFLMHKMSENRRLLLIIMCKNGKIVLIYLWAKFRGNEREQYEE